MYALFIGILIIVFFIPIPIKFKIKYDNKNLKISFYNIDITKKLKHINKKAKLDIKFKEDQTPMFSNSLKVVLKTLKRIKFKPLLKIGINIRYGVDDAAKTALTYGLISTLVAFLFELSKSFVILKCENININPDFNSFFLTGEIDSIISANLTKIIYITAIVYINLRRSQKINLANT